MKIKLTMSTILFASLSALAQTAPLSAGKMTLLKSNFDHSQANLEEYQKNLNIVEANLAEIGKTKAEVLAQKAEITAMAKDNKGALGRLDKNEKDVQKWTAEEKEKNLADERKIKELQALIAQLENNRKTRDANIQNYQQQAQQLADAKKSWNQRSEQIKGQDGVISGKVKSISATENEWKSKKKQYEQELSKWKSETEKHKNILDQTQAMVDVKR